MKNSVVKRLSCVLLVLVCAVTCLSLPSISASAVSKPSRTSITSLKRTSKSAVRLNWKKSSRAKAYEVFMKTNNGGFKRIKTTSSRALTKSGLKIGSSYCFRVRAYTTYKGRKYYSSYSSVKKIKMNSYVYLVDVMKPYSSDGYEEYTGANNFTMGGKKYFKGFTLGSSGDHYTIFNLQGKYSKIAFDLGARDGYDGESDRKSTIIVSEDDDAVKTFDRKGNSLPKYYSIDVRDCYKFEIEINNPYWCYLGFGNVKLYY